MTTFKNIGTLIGAIAAAAAAVGLTVGLAPASAAPTQSGANLAIYPDTATPGNYRVRVSGVFRMSEHDAHGFINNINTGERPGGMRYIYNGDDPGQHDPNVAGSGWYPGAGAHHGGYLRAESDGIHYYQEISVPKGQLNEDPNYFDDNDEIYVEAVFVDADGVGRTQVSNVITNLF
jgi:hypothetical protein